MLPVPPEIVYFPTVSRAALLVMHTGLVIWETFGVMKVALPPMAYLLASAVIVLSAAPGAQAILADKGQVTALAARTGSIVLCVKFRKFRNSEVSNTEHILGIAGILRQRPWSLGLQVAGHDSRCRH